MQAYPFTMGHLMVFLLLSVLASACNAAPSRREETFRQKCLEVMSANHA
ncbi:MAG: hypothetical protein O6934_03380 [SAR324 cluster bacterium]|nr:hypothetical protein [SAR324 cluster bacterium]